MKFFQYLKDNILFVATLFLLAFIPLYPKKPLLDIKNTWVYIRAEDFVVLGVLLLWAFLLIKKKVTFKTPLTIPILLFWIVGAIATIHGVLLIFPGLANVFPNVAFLSFLRHIEYMSLFFVAFSSIKEKRNLTPIVWVLTITLLVVVFYGFGQKYFGFPAYLTMNEEFAKGIPIQLSSLSRVPSTFAGHYDLAAYLVLVIPILTGLIFGFKNWLIKIVLLFSVILGFGLLFMTVSRVSFFVLIISLLLVLFLVKKKVVLYVLPVGILVTILFVLFQPSLFERYGSTVKEVDVLVDAKTGEAIGHVTYVSSSDLQDRIVWLTRIRSKSDLDEAVIGDRELKGASPSAILPYELLPEVVPLVIETNVSTGESLPQGTGYMNLSLSPTTHRLGRFFFEQAQDSDTDPKEIFVIDGDYLVKKASAYDLSFTTRFQGEWPRALASFKKNIFLGSGYGSVSLAVDNNYLRILGEIGLLGFIAFFGIFFLFGIYIRKVFPDIDSPVARTFMVGLFAGIIGLTLNAILIDVFEASKIAYVLWLLIGVAVGILTLYQKNTVHMFKELKSIAVSPIAISVYLFLICAVLFFPMMNNFFTGDDFTWLRWAADCQGGDCSMFGRISQYFTQSDGFFYRPGTKVYFYFMYNTFWLNQTVYHLVSLFLHITAGITLFFVARKILNNLVGAALVAFLFLSLSGFSEVIFWISATGHLLNAVCILLSLLFFMHWYEKKQIWHFVLSMIFSSLSLLFHELGVVVPFLLIFYAFYKQESHSPTAISRTPHYLFAFFPVFLYLLARFVSQSHWLNGDYSYNVVKLPFNFIGNGIGYVMLSLLGPLFLPVYQEFRTISKENIFVTGILVLLAGFISFFLYKSVKDVVTREDRRILLFSFAFFVITLLPFLGLGNITSRYSYLASAGVMLVFVFILQKIYDRIKHSGKDIAFVSITLLLLVFSLLHIIQIQQMHMDWHEASEKTKRFFTSIDNSYSEEWSTMPVEFYFVDVPIRVNEAWIFPVGLPDALWFTLKNNNLKVYKNLSLPDALNIAKNSLNSWVFKFNDDGSISKIDIPGRGVTK